MMHATKVSVFKSRHRHSSGYAMDLILNKYGQVKGLEDYLKQYAQDIIDNVELILEQEEDDFAPAMFNRVPARYQANVIVSNKPNSGAPVIFEDFPTHYNLRVM